MDLKATYNKIAEDWHNDHSQDDWWVEGTEMFLSMLEQGASILDVGCGAGTKTKYLAEKGFQVTGIDFSEKMIDIAKREQPGISFDVVDVYDIDTYPKTFEAVFAQATLLHIPKSRVHEVIAKLKEKLHPNGLLYIAVKAIGGNGVEEEIKKEDDYGYEYKRFFSYFTLDELEKYLTVLDMEVIWKTSAPSGRTVWLQTIGKKR